MTTFHDFSAARLDGTHESLSAYAGKVVLVVNTASACGFTPQYAGLQALHEKYAARGLVVLGFPCNQFGSQEPGTAEEIGAFCQMNYGVEFPMFAKIEVNGENAHPLYSWLRTQQPGDSGDGAIKWNFEKFLIGKDGAVIDRYPSAVTPESLRDDLEKAMGA